MTAEILVLLALLVLVAAGAAVGVVVVVRRRPVGRNALEADALSPRVVAEVHAGEEQVLLHLARTLELPTGRDLAAYGQVYIAGSAGTILQLRTRSEIGRGYDGEVRVHRTRSASVVEYYVLRLPGDETLHARIGELDGRIAAALRDLDPALRLRTPVPARRAAGSDASGG